MKNEIIYRVYDFLKEYPPFSLLTKDELMKISEQVTVKYLPPNNILFQIGEMPPPQFYIVNEGAIHLYQEDGDMVEQCDEGDVFGIRPLLAHSPYLLSAKSAEESILYAIKTSTFLPYLEKYPNVLSFLATNFAVGSANMFYKSRSHNTNIYSEIFKIDNEKALYFVHYSALYNTLQQKWLNLKQAPLLYAMKIKSP